MERSLLIGASALGVVGWLLSLVAASLGRSERDLSAWQQVQPLLRWTAILLPVLGFLVTLPSHAPFSAGQGLGRGFLIGAVASLLSALVIVGARRIERASVNAVRPWMSAAPLWLAIPATAIPLLFMRGVLMDALMGIAIGSLAVTAVVYQGLVPPEAGEDRTDTRLALLSGAAFCAAVTIAAGLGAYRGSEIVESSRWAAAAVLAATAVPLSVLVASLPAALLLRPLRRLPGAAAVTSKGATALRTEARRELAAGALRLVCGAIVLLVADRLLATRLLNDLHGFYVGAIGLAVGFLAWWLAVDGAHGTLGDDGNHRRPLAVLVALGAAMACFNLLLGFGIALMSLALWLPFSLALYGRGDLSPDEVVDRRAAMAGVGQALWSVVAFTVVLAAYRFIATRFQTELRGVILTDHYAIFGFLAGATIPGIVAAVASGAPAERAPSVARLLRLVAAGLLVLALPGLILILWKAKSALALLSGAALAAAGFDWLQGQGRPGTWSRPYVPLMAIAVSLALAQWTPQALEVASLTRDQKIHFLEWLVGGIAFVLVVIDLAERWRAARARGRWQGQGQEAVQ